LQGLSAVYRGHGYYRGHGTGRARRLFIIPGRSRKMKTDRK